jgi:hypothetical protein
MEPRDDSSPAEALGSLATRMWQLGGTLRIVVLALALATYAAVAPRRPIGKRGPETDREARSGDRALPRRGGCCLAGERVALRGDARSMPALRPRLSRPLARATAAPWRRRTRSVRAGGLWCRGDACGGDRGGPSLAPRAEFLMVSEAHEVVVPCSLKVQAPEPDFEFGREGVRAAHGVTLTAVLGVNHHRESW